MNLWIINDKLGAAISRRGRAGGFHHQRQIARLSPDVVKTSLFAVTVEPAGGSANGKPSGPRFSAGKLIQALP